MTYQVLNKCINRYVILACLSFHQHAMQLSYDKEATEVLKTILIQNFKEEQKLKISKKLVQQGADPRYARSLSGKSLLYLAAKHNDLDAVKTFLMFGANPKLFLHKTALHAAAAHGNIAMLDLLLKYGSSVNARDASGTTALYQAVSYAQIAAVKKLLLHKADPNICPCLAGTAPLHLAVLYENLPILETLITAGASINQRSKFEKSTALHFAAYFNKLRAIQKLLEHNANINMQDKNGQTALHIAAARGYTTVAKHLVESGASLAIKNKDKLTALEEAAFWGKEDIIFLLMHMGGFSLLNQASNALDIAIRRSHISVVKRLINMLGGTQQSPLHIAAKLNAIIALDLLIPSSNQQELAAYDACGLTPLDLAIMHGHYSSVVKLLRAGAPVNQMTLEKADHLPHKFTRIYNVIAKLLQLQLAKILQPLTKKFSITFANNTVSERHIDKRHEQEINEYYEISISSKLPILSPEIMWMIIALTIPLKSYS